MAGCPGSVVPGARREISFTDELAALSERRFLAEHRLHIGNRRAFDAQKLMAHAMKMFSDDMEAGFGQKMVNVGDASVQRILDRNDGQIGVAVADGGERVFECRARQRHRVWECFARGEIGISAGLTLKGYAKRFGLRAHGGADCCFAASRALARSSAVSTESGGLS